MITTESRTSHTAIVRNSVQKGLSDRVIFLRTPYDSLRDVHIDWAAWWARRGYAVAIQENRGRFKSEGTFYSYHDDGRDGHDALEWIAAQPWCNGKIGMSGRSYGGIVQWQAAPYRSPHLSATAPQVIMGDYFGDCHRIGGAVQWALTVMAAITFTTTVHLTQRGCLHLFGTKQFLKHLPLMETDVAVGPAMSRPGFFPLSQCAYCIVPISASSCASAWWILSRRCSISISTSIRMLLDGLVPGAPASNVAVYPRLQTYSRDEPRTRRSVFSTHRR